MMEDEGLWIHEGEWLGSEVPWKPCQSKPKPKTLIMVLMCELSRGLDLVMFYDFLLLNVILRS